MTVNAAVSAAIALTAGTLVISGCKAASGHQAGPIDATSTPTATTSVTGTPSPIPTTPVPTWKVPKPSIPITAILARCQTSQLRATLSNPDGAAGNRYQHLTLRNVGAPCRMWGWVRLQLEGPYVGLVPTSVVHTGTPTTFVLPTGGIASALLHWTAVPSGDEPDTGQCEPVGSQLYVYPPGQTTARVPAWSWGPVCGHGTFDVSPMHP